MLITDALGEHGGAEISWKNCMNEQTSSDWLAENWNQLIIPFNDLIGPCQSGQSHELITGVCLWVNKQEEDTHVLLNTLGGK